ncbi:hypothetical protein SacmaDRAFT_0538 [Saccharomonospora marina XMU15]|uniref:Uncharacterized protein n=1 Tax=Saccharomonospora marina XMU15 TaxID=882083 RepID=H5X496_9PSEU|nr:hypothetical protein [Saccharomonospora marina]EHR48839.1 hypothetical protein SacmaDRAFT_0538 [Saccharomonospora marina XMU15]
MTDSDESDDQRRSRGLPPAPRPPGEERERVDPPTPVKISFVLWLLSGAVLVAGFGYTLTAKEEIIEAILAVNNDPNISEEQIRSGATTLLWTLFVGALVFAILFALFAYKAREGTRSARTILTVLAAIVLIFQLVLFSNLITLAAAFLAIVAVVLMYLPTVADYFPKVPKSLPRS